MLLGFRISHCNVPHILLDINRRKVVSKPEKIIPLPSLMDREMKIALIHLKTAQFMSGHHERHKSHH